MRSGKTVQFQPTNLPPKLFVIRDGQVEVFDLYGAQSLGRPSHSGTPHIPIPQKVVSRNHGSFLTTGGQTFYSDTASTNGTIYNGVPLPVAARQLLNDGDVLRIHGRDDPMNKLDVIMIYSVSYSAQALWDQLPLTPYMNQITIGREGTICLNSPAVSHQHASIYLAEGGWAVIDHGSHNGVFVNNRRLYQPVYLQPMDVIGIAGYHILFTGSGLIYQADFHSNDASTMPMQPDDPYGGYAPVPTDRWR